jgi:nucleolin
MGRGARKDAVKQPKRTKKREKTTSDADGSEDGNNNKNKDDPNDKEVGQESPEHQNLQDEEEDDDDDSGSNRASNEQHQQQQGEKNKRKRKRKRSGKTAGRKDKTEDDGEKQAKDALDAATGTGTGLAGDSHKALQVDRTVYVEGIPFAAKPADVRNFFAERLAAKEDGDGDDTIEDVRLPVYHDSGRLRGYGHVVLTSAALYRQALALSGQHLQGRYLTIVPANQPKTTQQQQQQKALNNSSSSSSAATAEPSKVIALHNLSYDATEGDIERVMRQFGAVAAGGIRVVRHSGGAQLSKGFAYVEYEAVESAMNAFRNAASIAILDRPCRVDYDHGRVRGSFRTADRKLWQKQYGTPTTTSSSSGSSQRDSKKPQPRS